MTSRAGGVESADNLKRIPYLVFGGTEAHLQESGPNGVEEKGRAAEKSTSEEVFAIAGSNATGGNEGPENFRKSGARHRFPTPSPFTGRSGGGKKTPTSRRKKGRKRKKKDRRGAVETQ